MKNEQRDERKSRKILVPLATLAIASAVAVGSGADFTSTSQITADITAGQIIANNNKDKGTLTITQLKPGDEASGTVQLTRGTGSNLSGDLSVVIDNVTSGFEADAVTISVDGNSTSGTADLETVEQSADHKATIDLGSLPDNWGYRDIKITVSMPTTAGNNNQAATGSASIHFVVTATDGATDQETTASWS